MIKTRPGSEKTLGQILIAKGVINKKQLDLALKIKDVQPDKYLGEILFQIGASGKNQPGPLLFCKRKTIGEILIKQQLIGESLKIKVSDVSERRILLREPKSGKEAEVAYMPEPVANGSELFGMRISHRRIGCFRSAIRPHGQ